MDFNAIVEAVKDFAANIDMEQVKAIFTVIVDAVKEIIAMFGA